MKESNDPKFEHQKNLLPWMFLGFSAVILIIVWITGIVRYDAIPASFVNHIGPSGPSEKVAKGFGSVFSVAMIGTVFLVVGVFVVLMLNRSRGQTESATKISQIEFYSALAGAVVFVSSAFIDPLAFFTYFSVNLAWLATGFVALIIVLVLLPVQYGRYAKAIEADTASSEESRSFIHHTKLGIFYFDKEDSRVWVPRPPTAGNGITMNLGRPVGVFVFVALLVAMAATILFLSMGINNH